MLKLNRERPDINVLLGSKPEYRMLAEKYLPKTVFKEEFDHRALLKFNFEKNYD